MYIWSIMYIFKCLAWSVKILFVLWKLEEFLLIESQLPTNIDRQGVCVYSVHQTPRYDQHFCPPKLVQRISSFSLNNCVAAPFDPWNQPLQLSTEQLLPSSSLQLESLLYSVYQFSVEIRHSLICAVATHFDASSKWWGQQHHMHFNIFYHNE